MKFMSTLQYFMYRLELARYEVDIEDTIFIHRLARYEVDAKDTVFMYRLTRYDVDARHNIGATRDSP